jgi:rare lipoprotein A
MALLPLGACSQGGPAPDPQLGVAASPRVAAAGAVPKGGGIYKVGKPYQVAGRWYVPRAVDRYDEQGIASWYGAAFHGRRTANGEIYDMNALTAGHPTLPLPSYAYVTNLNNGRTILVRVNDRGPYVNDRLIDLSRRSATELGYSRHGLARVRVRYAGPAPLDGNDAAERRHLAAQPWYDANFGVAYAPASDLVTGAIGPSGPSAGTSRPAALGGPLRQAAGAGPFASRAEAERMRHEMGEARAVVVEVAEAGAEPSFFVRIAPQSARRVGVGLRR